MASCSQHVLGQKSLIQLKKYFYQCDQYYNIILLQLQYSSGSWLWKLLVSLTPFTYISFSVCLMRCYSCVSLYLIIYFLLTSVFMLESEKKENWLLHFSSEFPKIFACPVRQVYNNIHQPNTQLMLRHHHSSTPGSYTHTAVSSVYEFGLNK